MATDYKQLMLAVLIIGTLISLLIALLNQKIRKIIGIITLFIYLGISSYYYQYHSNLCDNLHKHKNIIIGIVANHTHNNGTSFPHCVTIRLIKYKKYKTNAWQKSDKNIRIYCKYVDPHLSVDDTVKIGPLACNQTKKNDFARYLMGENIAATAFVSQLKTITLYRPDYSINRFINNKRSSIIDAGEKQLNPDTFAFFASLFLGNRAVNQNEIDILNNHFQQWGIVHYLARSGLHLVIFVFIWQLFLRFLPIHYFIKQLLILLLCIIYHLISFPSIPFLRALATLCLHTVANNASIQTTSLYSVVTICFIFLLFNPVLIFSLNFQLSFLLTFSLAWFMYIYRPA